MCAQVCGLAFPPFLPILLFVLYLLIKGGGFAHVLPALALQSAWARNGAAVLSAMEDGIQRAYVEREATSAHVDLHEIDTPLAAAPASSPSLPSALCGTSLRNALTSCVHAWCRARRARAWLAHACSLRCMGCLHRRTYRADGHAQLSARLGKQLPWLLAHDRRDALVIRELLDTLLRHDDVTYRASDAFDSPAAQKQMEAMCALAASCYAAALLRPSAADGTGDGASGDAHAGHVPQRRARVDVHTWLGERGLALPMDTPIRLAALAEHGWYALRGAPCVLGTPLGRLVLLSPPVTAATTGGHAVWHAAPLQPMRQTRVAVQLCVWMAALCCMSLLGISMAISYLLDLPNTSKGRWSRSATANYARCAQAGLVVIKPSPSP
jgi:hypothetical protein